MEGKGGAMAKMILEIYTERVKKQEPENKGLYINEIGEMEDAHVWGPSVEPEMEIEDIRKLLDINIDDLGDLAKKYFNGFREHILGVDNLASKKTRQSFVSIVEYYIAVSVMTWEPDEAWKPDEAVMSRAEDHLIEQISEIISVYRDHQITFKDEKNCILHGDKFFGDIASYPVLPKQPFPNILYHFSLIDYIGTRDGKERPSIDKVEVALSRDIYKIYMRIAAKYLVSDKVNFHHSFNKVIKGKKPKTFEEWKEKKTKMWGYAKGRIWTSTIKSNSEKEAEKRDKAKATGNVVKLIIFIVIVLFSCIILVGFMFMVWAFFLSNADTFLGRLSDAKFGIIYVFSYYFRRAQEKKIKRAEEAIARIQEPDV